MAHNSTEGERVGKWSDSGALNSGWLGYTGHQRQAELFIKKAFTNRIYVFACIHVKQTYKVSITSTNTWSSGFLSLFIQLDITNPNDIIHNKIYFVCMGVCACMWSFVCLCVQLARSETKVKGLRRFPLYLWDSPPVNPELTNLVTVWLEATSVLPRLIHCMGAEIWIQALMPVTHLTHWDIPQPKLHTFGILCSYHQKP